MRKHKPIRWTLFSTDISFLGLSLDSFPSISVRSFSVFYSRKFPRYYLVSTFTNGEALHFEFSIDSVNQRQIKELIISEFTISFPIS